MRKKAEKQKEVDPAGSANLFRADLNQKTPMKQSSDGGEIAVIAELEIFSNFFPRCLHCKKRAVLE